MKVSDCSISDLLKVLEYFEQRSAGYARELDRRCLQWGISIVDGHLNIDGRFSVRNGGSVDSIIDDLKALLTPSEEGEPLEAPAPEEIEVRCPECGSHRLEEIGVGIHAGTLYKCWECRNEWEDGI